MFQISNRAIEQTYMKTPNAPATAKQDAKPTKTLDNAAKEIAIPAATTKQTASTSTAIASPVAHDSHNKGVTADAIANGFSTLVGALIGAMLAYWLQNKLLRRQEKNNARLSAHRTMFSLLQQINTIMLIQRDYVFANLDSPARFITIMPTPPFDPDKSVLNINDLTFLLDTKEGRAVLYELYIAQENYVTAINHWNLRSNIHVQQVQPALAAAGILPGSPVTLESFENALGPLLHATENSLMTLRRAFEKLAACKDKARAYAVHRFKSNDFTDFDFPDTYGITKNPE